MVAGPSSEGGCDPLLAVLSVETDGQVPVVRGSSAGSSEEPLAFPTESFKAGRNRFSG